VAEQNREEHQYGQFVQRGSRPEIAIHVHMLSYQLSLKSLFAMYGVGIICYTALRVVVSVVMSTIGCSRSDIISHFRFSEDIGTNGTADLMLQ
jgi:hypothetical protein